MNAEVALEWIKEWLDVEPEPWQRELLVSLFGTGNGERPHRGGRTSTTELADRIRVTVGFDGTLHGDVITRASVFTQQTHCPSTVIMDEIHQWWPAVPVVRFRPADQPETPPEQSRTDRLVHERMSTAGGSAAFYLGKPCDWPATIRHWERSWNEGRR